MKNQKLEKKLIKTKSKTIKKLKIKIKHQNF